MKLCPECDFIYEDNQSFCDMDGKELILKAAAEPRFRLTIPVKPADIAKAAPSRVSKGRSSSSLVLVAVVVILLTAIVVAVYVARQRQNRARSAQPIQPSVQAVVDQSTRTSTQPATEQTPESQPPSDQTSDDRAEDAVSSASPDESAQTASAKVSLAHSRLNPGPVSASATAASGRGPVIVRLTNGAVIKADDAWEKKEGVWYRQAGMVTFLKRSRVRSIERIPAPPHSQSTSTNAAGRSSSEGGVDGDRNQTAKRTRSRDQLRNAKLEPATPKKDSRVTSFFKKTGKLIKKPFKF